MIYIGIDPGKNGGIAWIEDEKHHTEPYSDDGMLDLFGICKYEACMCCLEKVGAMPGQGVTSMFNFGVSYGYIQGVLEAFGIPYQEIAPKRWKAEFGLNSDKGNSIEVCKKLFPDVSLRRTERCKIDHDGMAEALLMAEYARRRL